MVYAALNSVASIQGPGLAASIGYGSKSAEEGIEIEMEEDAVNRLMGIGAGVYSLNPNKPGNITLTLLQTSPTNQVLFQAYDFQRSAASLTGQNVINATNTQSGESSTCRFVAFKRKPKITYARDVSKYIWEFFALEIDTQGGVWP